MCLNTFLMKVSDIKVKFLMISLYRSYLFAISPSDDTSAIKIFLFFSVPMASFPFFARLLFLSMERRPHQLYSISSLPDSLNVMYHLFLFSAAWPNRRLFSKSVIFLLSLYFSSHCLSIRQNAFWAKKFAGSRNCRQLKFLMFLESHPDRTDIQIQHHIF